ncbi:MAG: 2,3-bisphosphoglycerate-independent phosphoglycerate mutase, partial [Candidatus Micrarchaeota archaeon]
MAVVLLVLDGWGIAPPGPGNAVGLAKKPNFDFLWSHAPHTAIGAGGQSIRLDPGHQGASEIGHLIMGAGRNNVLPQQIIYHAFKTGGFGKNKAYLTAIKSAAKKNKALHLMGLLSDKGVHCYDWMFHELIKVAAENGVEKLFVHVFTDGRDTHQKKALKYVRRLEAITKQFKLGRIATVTGRYWAMDRDRRWDRVEKVFNCIVNGKGEFTAKSGAGAIENAYARADKDLANGEEFVETDEFIKPTVIVDSKK